MVSRILSLLVLCFAFALFGAGPVAAQSGFERVVRVDPVMREGNLYIDADVEFEVSSELRTAAQKGVPIYFIADLRITTQRWWWFDRVAVDQQMTWRIVYNALTRQWRVGSGELSIPVASFDDALSFVRNIRGWAVARAEELDIDEEYQGRIRVRLDTSRLPRPFQIDAYNSSAWSLATPWKDFQFSVSAGDHPPS
ncbi:DUF4390 domain-containing protein [Pusillimonas noertemannii]|uniref:Uncharacterized protein DUF4390 n=1 Tax=Pusillimonas noertemannii TaxID=305977 RepID=A0A2U1CNA0_9BURK|nr:DUF4390 domain-containing protein [Pusillimonas noertemannii]NYT68487.1 DUF4390 domain-containing protein [Pusillimonas noertemannii]PVY62496.1 uncharacterized protein DUF4390 [Pusillimonas noertemannii]TFL10549.1 DUF4390 domain-containing protein [Pusillimonas noertemannii]